MKTHFVEKAIEKAAKDCEKLAKEYNIPVSTVVWMGNNKYCIVKNGEIILRGLAHEN